MLVNYDNKDFHIKYKWQHWHQNISQQQKDQKSRVGFELMIHRSRYLSLVEESRPYSIGLPRDMLVSVNLGCSACFSHFHCNEIRTALLGMLDLLKFEQV